MADQHTCPKQHAKWRAQYLRIASGLALKRKRVGELLSDKATSKIPVDVEPCFSAPTYKMDIKQLQEFVYTSANFRSWIWRGVNYHHSTEIKTALRTKGLNILYLCSISILQISLFQIRNHV